MNAKSFRVERAYPGRPSPLPLETRTAPGAGQA